MASPRKIKKIRNTIFILILSLALISSILVWRLANTNNSSTELSIFSDIEGTWESTKYGEISIEKMFSSSERKIKINMKLNNETINETLKILNVNNDKTKFTLRIDKKNALTFQKIYNEDCSCYWHLLIVNDQAPEIINKK